ncbi:MAG TPA: methyltransferase domain-containing protein [Noviherbaspirillum sp.]|uniref:methyltransferase domain-containing protein n=1 Tax=Noviherbaspirillum sp. TaxID=1926288 RepID=UPI002D709B73|nr:methyltransferase domain-containing protein [Noviherbaspirillum sp.]HYD96757.1 methyltransferase domain-containing protein [Noviherbaspirillum sp.]
MKHAANAEYSSLPERGITEKILTSQRRKLFAAFTGFRQAAPLGTVLNVYMKPTTLFDNSDYLFAWSDLPERMRLTACEMEAPAVASKAHDTRLPYPDGAFDWVFCNEVLEHSGGTERQYALVQELYRVARRGVFLTTANRRHPLEFKSRIPLIHLLPDAWWRRLLKWSGKGKWASESMLNPVDAPALYRFASLLPGKPEHDVGHKRVLGVKAHFFLMIHKRRTA